MKNFRIVKTKLLSLKIIHQDRLSSYIMMKKTPLFSTIAPKSHIFFQKLSRRKSWTRQIILGRKIWIQLPKPGIFLKLPKRLVWMPRWLQRILSLFRTLPFLENRFHAITQRKNWESWLSACTKTRLAMLLETKKAKTIRTI